VKTYAVAEVVPSADLKRRFGFCVLSAGVALVASCGQDAIAAKALAPVVDAGAGIEDTVLLDNDTGIGDALTCCSCDAGTTVDEASAECPPAWFPMAVDDASICVPDYPVWGIGPPTPVGFTANGDGTVSHTLTGLQWQLDSTQAKDLSWTKAMAYCQALKLAGYSDWRLPTAAELSSSFQLGRQGKMDGTALPFLPVTPFPALNFKHWSASRDASDSARAWILAPDNYLRPEGMTTVAYARCVRGSSSKAEPAIRFEIQADEVVVDHATGLFWERCPDDQMFTWTEARSRCNTNLAGLPGAGWRLPTIRELESLIDRTTFAPASPGVFANSLMEPMATFPYTGYWTSTGLGGQPEDDDLDFRYVLHHYDGSIYNKCVDPSTGCPNLARVRCVR